ncbi:hypothetical protein D2L64_18635 [Micromonospora radicis]|uniref:Uncharacterized protein n=2 Tax=Micromonospora radicis TaxID=1894971 RepID=A0A418MS54_9ACTN|nr:hypothetical protein D2L64_18635 [Micromonospora radicis]
MAVFSAAYLAWALPAPVGIVLAVALPLLVLRLPVTGIVLVAVLAQEIKPNGRFGELTTLGHQLLISTGKIPAVLPLALTAALAAVARWWPAQRPQLRSPGGMLIGIAAGLVAVATGVGLLHGQSVFSAVNQNARPFVLLLLGLVIGMSLRWLPDDRKSLMPTVGAALTLLLVAAAVAIALGEIADERLSAYFVYYDSALPAIAAAVSLGMLGYAGWRWDWRHLTVAVAAPLLVVVSFRRSVWLAALVVVIVALVLSGARWRRTFQQLAFVGVVVAAVVFAAPGLAGDVGLRSAGSFELAGGDNAQTEPAPAPTDPGPAQTDPAPAPADPTDPGPASADPNAPSASPPPAASGSPATSEPAATGAPTGQRAAPQPTGQSEPPQPTGQVSSPGSAEAPGAAPRPAPGPASAEHQAASTSGHLDDLRIGWEQVRANPWTGIGPLAPQLPGVAADQAERIYVHNQLLQDWLRYGPLAPLLVVLFFVVAGLVALARLRDPDSDLVSRVSAAFCLIAPPCLMTAPFLSETSRWPLVTGIMAGILVGQAGLRRGVR